MNTGWLVLYCTDRPVSVRVTTVLLDPVMRVPLKPNWLIGVPMCGPKFWVTLIGNGHTPGSGLVTVNQPGGSGSAPAVTGTAIAAVTVMRNQPSPVIPARSPFIAASRQPLTPPEP